ncbi:MAG TPA: antibiotic biosynthesis monooxygenase [Dietzia timorensis]|uniref:Antibiotic biosynthesis monooxygenase n=1 Tax=Dietzia timorensis TaxID=499555 RepID=A0A921F822_9ACTN|nr:antibiotic biosynthesis monooxygenase [Dietzia timorensis]HJE91859.1 antibiotic biosynthesis monooxygenase [Dietzia timorensis]
MVLESGTLPVIPGKEEEFEAAFEQAKSLIAGSPGCISVELRRKVEVPNEYLLLVQWETIEDHTEGFRGSEAFTAWRELLHHFYEPKPVMEHFTFVAGETGVAGS